MYLGLMDQYGQIVSIEAGSKINFNLLPALDGESFFITEIIGVTDFFSAYGTYNVSGMGLIASPGAELNVKVQIDSINTNITSAREYLEFSLGEEIAPGDPYTINLELEVRPCRLGEGLKESGACFECTVGTYLLEAPTDTPVNCTSCPVEKA